MLKGTKKSKKEPKGAGDVRESEKKQQQGAPDGAPGRVEYCKGRGCVVHSSQQSMAARVTEGRENIPSKPVVVLPNRLDLCALQVLEEELGGNSHITWLVENSLQPGQEVMTYLRGRGAYGVLSAMDRQKPEQLAELVRREMESGRHVVLLVGRPLQAAGTLSDVPGPLLEQVVATGFACLPVHVGMVSLQPWSPVTVSSGRYDRVELRFGRVLRDRYLSVGAVLSAWMEAQSALYGALPTLGYSLPAALVKAMQTHPEAALIDGVDDTQLPNSKLLPLTLMLASSLRRKVPQGRVGVILPPGKLAVITYIACLFAGVTPVCINYHAAKEQFRHIVRQTGLTRYITEKRFVSKMDKFPWPRSRDLIYIERELAEMGGARLTYWRALSRFTGAEFLTRMLSQQKSKPDAEAVVVFTGGTDSVPKGVSLSHRMLLTGMAELTSRLDFRAGMTVLSLLPYGYPTGLITGLLLPLLAGFNVVTYPTEDAGNRICELVRQYKVSMAVSTPKDLAKILPAAKDDTFASMRYLLSVGEKLPDSLAAYAAGKLRLTVLEGYTMEEVVPMVSMTLPPLRVPAGTRHAKPVWQRGSVGEPLPGMAVRVADPEHEDRLMPCDSPGMIWLKSPTLATRYLEENPEVKQNVRNGWFRTGDVGRLSADGLLTLCGRKTRFSMVDGRLQAHEELEQALLEVFQADTTKPGRKIAVVGVREASGHEKLVVLSTLHRQVVASDRITMEYGLKNAGYRHLSPPQTIIPVSYIPELPDGKLDYKLCHEGACKALGLPLR